MSAPANPTGPVDLIQGIARRELGGEMTIPAEDLSALFEAYRTLYPGWSLEDIACLIVLG